MATLQCAVSVCHLAARSQNVIVTSTVSLNELGVLLQGSEVENPDVAMTRKPDDAEPFSGLAFKIMADPFVGTLTFVRIYR